MSDSPEVSQQTGAHQGGTEWAKRLEQVDRHVASKVEQVVRDLQDLAAAAEEKAVGQLLAATTRVDGAETQRDILKALVDEGRRFASRTAFFLTRPGEVRGWSARGFDDQAPSLDGRHFAYEEGSVWARMARTAGTVTLAGEECAEVCRSLDASPGEQGVLIPLVLRGQLGGVLFADRIASDETLGTASLQLLTHSAAQAIETLAIRGGGSSPALRGEASEASPVALFQPQDEGAEPSAVESSEVADGVRTAATAVGAAAVVGAAAAGISSVLGETSTEEVTAPIEEAPGVDAAPEVDEAVAEEEASVVEEEAAVARDDAATDDAVADEPAASEALVEEPLAEPEVEITAEPTELAEEVVALDGEAEELTAAVEIQPDSETVEEVDFEMVSTAGPDEIEPLEPEELTEEDLEAAAADIEVERTPEPELEDTSDLWASGSDEEPTLVETAPREEAPLPPPAPAITPDPTVGQETVRLDIAALQGQMPGGAPPVAEETAPAAAVEETAKVPEWDVEPVPATRSTEPEFELEPDEPAYELEPDSEAVTTPMAQPDFATGSDDISEDPTIMTARGDLGVTPPAEPAPMSGGYVPPAPEEVTPPPSTGFAPPPAKPDATGSTQVVPPTDIQGPGSAFGGSSGIPDGEEALHEEARRLARLLVSEIKLYNEEIIEEGRRAGNIYDRLKDDIDRSRQMYEERIDPRLNESGNDYFRAELVQRLAGGDERILGY
ncbi:MAG: hypothetical protein AAF657_01555 [Acidobacteriota bacterium]